METLGSLVDKLTICNIKIWMAIDESRDMNNDEGVRMRAFESVSNVNIERNMLIDEIDVLAKTACESFPINPKNKMYK